MKPTLIISRVAECSNVMAWHSFQSIELLRCNALEIGTPKVMDVDFAFAQIPPYSLIVIRSVSQVIVVIYLGFCYQSSESMSSLSLFVGTQVLLKKSAFIEVGISSISGPVGGVSITCPVITVRVSMGAGIEMDIT